MHASSCLLRSMCAILRPTPTSHRIFINACKRRKIPQQELWLSCLACMKACQGIQLDSTALPCSNSAIVLPRDGCTSEHLRMPGWTWVHCTHQNLPVRPVQEMLTLSLLGNHTAARWVADRP